MPRLLVSLIIAASACVGPPAHAATMPPSSPSLVPSRSVEWEPERVRIGSSVEGRGIFAYRVGNNNAEHTMLLLGQMHGDEPAGLRTARWATRFGPVKGIDLWVIPTVNPDGAVRGSRKNARGVDLNRNWGWSWRASKKSSKYYSGPAAWSEPETVALREFINQIDPKWIVSLHQPLYAIDADSKSRKLHNALVARLPMPSRSLKCNGVCHGTMTGWVNHRTPSAAITVEYGPHPARSFVRHRARRAIVNALGGRY